MRIFLTPAGLAAAVILFAAPVLAQNAEPLRLPPTSPSMIIPGLAGVITVSQQPAEVKAEAQKLWAQGSQLNRVGRQGEAWRVLERARAMATGQPWTEKEEFAQSLVLRPDAPVTDPSRPFFVRVTQRYTASYPLASGLKLKLSLVEPISERKLVRELTTVDGVRLDLIEKPFGFSIDLDGVPAGRYHLLAAISDGDAPLGRLETSLWVVPKLDTQYAAVRQKLAEITGHEGTKARILYPFDLARVVNAGARDPALVDYGAEIARSLQLLEGLAAGKDLLHQARGDLKKAYWFAEGGEVMPYRIYVPAKWQPGTQLPMVVYLHGLGSDENSAFEWPYERATAKWIDGKLAAIAEERGVIAVAPLGFRISGNWGGNAGFLNQMSSPQPGEKSVVVDPFDRKVYTMAEADTLNVVDIVAREYNADPKRTYLIGNSAGGGGTMYLGAKYSQRWAALGPSAIPYNALSFHPFEQYKGVPMLVTHGTNDPVALVKNSRESTAFLKEKGVDVTLLEVTNVETASAHNAAWFAALPQIMDFLTKHARN